MSHREGGGKCQRVEHQHCTPVPGRRSNMHAGSDLTVYNNRPHFPVFGAIVAGLLLACAFLVVPRVNTAVTVASLRTAHEVIASQLRCGRLRAEAVPSQRCGVFFDTVTASALVFVDSPRGKTRRFVPGEDIVVVPTRAIPGSVRIAIPEAGGIRDCVVLFGTAGRVERGGRWELRTVADAGRSVHEVADGDEDRVSMVVH